MWFKRKEKEQESIWHDYATEKPLYTYKVLLMGEDKQTRMCRYYVSEYHDDAWFSLPKHVLANTDFIKWCYIIDIK